MTADKNLNKDIGTLLDKISDPHIPFNDDNVHRQITDLVLNLKKVKKLAKDIEPKVEGTKILPFIIKYLNDPND